MRCDRPPAKAPRDADRHLICEADRLRDAGQYAAAAAALAMAPERTDICVQYGNMLKDSGRPAEAEAVDRQVLAVLPNDSDIHVQLGHALKLQGRHNDAVAAYRRAAERGRTMPRRCVSCSSRLLG